MYSKYRLIIFDFDGTLADSYPWFRSNFTLLARRYRLPPLDGPSLEKLRALEIRQVLKEYKIPLWKAVVMGNHLKKMMSSQIDQVFLVKGMQSVIETLAGMDVILAVVTSNAGRNVRRVLGESNLAYFKFIESGVSMFGKKKKFQKILKKTGVLPNEALSIGDEVRDLKSARDAQISFGAVTWGYTAESTLREHSPEEVFDHPQQILSAVRSAPSPHLPGRQLHPGRDAAG